MVSEMMYELGSKRSAIRELFEYGKTRAKIVGSENVFNFSIGSPTVPAPACVKEAMLDVLETQTSAQIHGYTSAQGDDETRTAIAEDLNARFGTDFTAKNLFMTCGAAASLTCCFHALCESPEDEFVAIAPFFPEYQVFVAGTGAKFRVVEADVPSFQISFEKLAAALNAHTKAVIINSPNNPSGVVYSEETIQKLAALLQEKSEAFGHPIMLISDEPYREIVFDGIQVPFVTKYYDNTLVCYSYSKSLSLPGERIGYVLVPDAVTEAARVYAAVAGAARALGFVCAPSLFQKVIAKCAGKTADMEVYRENRDVLYEGLKRLGYECVHPDGAFYLFVKALEPDADAFCKKAMEQDLLLVSATDFGCPAYVRIAYCVDKDMILRSMKAFEKLAAAYR